MFRICHCFMFSWNERIDKIHTASFGQIISGRFFTQHFFVYLSLSYHSGPCSSYIAYYIRHYFVIILFCLICFFKCVCRINWLDWVVWDHLVMHMWRTGLWSMSWSVVNVCLNFLLYRRRNVRRLKKCSKANEVLSLQRILPSEPKRKMKLLDQAQLSRITGLWKLWTRHLGEWKFILIGCSKLNFHVKLQQCFSGELAQGFSVLYQFIHIDKILKILHSWLWEQRLRGCRGNLQHVRIVWFPNLLCCSQVYSRSRASDWEENGTVCCRCWSHKGMEEPIVMWHVALPAHTAFRHDFLLFFIVRAVSMVLF